MSRWFRFYDDAINDPKALRLSDSMHRSWVGLLCIASKNDGVLPSIDDMAIMLRTDVSSVEKIITELIERELIDRIRGGDLCPHNWRKRQYKSDVSTDRVKRFRKRRETVSETSPETEADTENRTEKKDTRAVAKATRTEVDPAFDEFWKACPKRHGANPKALAKKKFIAVVKSGTDPQAMNAAARQWATSDRDKIGTPYIPQIATWLGQQRFDDYRPPPATAGLLQAPDGAPSDAELRKKYGQQHHAVPPETKAASGDGAGADHATELRREGAEIRPNLRGF